MSEIDRLLEQNKAWAAKLKAKKPDFFDRLSKLQNPEYLWIGCSDSRVPANQITGLAPGEVFVHRNVANVVVHADLNCLSVLQYAVDVLKVKHIIVCGHYGCGGVVAATQNVKLGLIDNWLRHVQDVSERHRDIIENAKVLDLKVHRLCELNVIEQVINVCRTTVVQDAWNRQQNLTVHGLIYDITDGLLKDLGMSISKPHEMDLTHKAAVNMIATGATTK